MILFVWSLVSSAIEAARRRLIANFLRAWLAEQRHLQEPEMLIWKSLRNLEGNVGRLARFRSESQLDSCLVFQNQLLQVFARKFEQLRSNDWRFLPAIWPAADECVYFVAGGKPTLPEAEDALDELRPTYFKLDEKCERLALHRTNCETFFVCGLDVFVEVVDAFSEGLLRNDNFSVVSLQSMFAPPREMQPRLQPQSFRSTVSLSPTCHRPMSILEQLFWGDGKSLSPRERFASETALHLNSNASPMRHRFVTSSARSSRRRHVSCNSRVAASDISILQQNGVDTARLLHDFDFSFGSLPRYIRHLDRDFRSQTSLTNGPESTKAEVSSSGRSEASCSTSEDRCTSSSLATDTPNFADGPSTTAIIRDQTMDDIRLIDDTDTETIDSSRYIQARRLSPERTRFAKVEERRRSPEEAKSNLDEAKRVEVVLNGCRIIEEEHLNGKVDVLPTREVPSSSQPPLPLENGVARSRRSASVVPPRYGKCSQRRFSAFPSDQFGDRNRSLSPSFEYFQLRSLRSLSLHTQERACDSGRSRPYTPSFLSSRDKSVRSMAKPPSILVYTAGEAQLYEEIRERLAHLLPPEEVTVFNISIDALRKQPWIEPATVCVILASTSDLDDVVWTKMQTYFNQKGKIIFVCQNGLLANLTQCDSSKQQADIMRMAFGGRTKLEETNKEFAKFLKKCLRHLDKNAEVDETFRSNDVGAKLTVVIKKEKEAPMLLYMHNSDSHLASAVFSDATTEQLIAPNSNLLRDSLESVGVKVQEISAKSLTPATLVGKSDDTIKNIAGIRYGEKVGTEPKLFIRTSEVASDEGLPAATPSLLPIEVITKKEARPTSTSGNFDFGLFFETLRSKYGDVLLHVPVTTTTMDVCSSICDAIPSLDNVVVVADYQRKGRGRGGNEWLSPEGVAMFTMAFHVPKKAKIAATLPIVQHVFCVAVVDAAQRIAQVENFPLRIKWPNDFYFNRSHKVGGILVAVKGRDDGFLVSIGCGLNVSNKKPTICLNDMLPEEATKRITIEELIAETLNRFQYWMNDFERNGRENFVKKYYEYWLHNFEEVVLEDGNEKVAIRGIDNNGYLEVRSKGNPAKVFSIGDNGNTFDMMKGLIRHKA